MKTTFFDTPNAALALNHKVASSSLAKAIVKKFYSELAEKMYNAHYPEGLSAETVRWHSICPKTEPASKQDTVLIVREPVDRFISACHTSKTTDIDGKLSKLESGNFGADPHFWPQNRFSETATVLFKYPEHIADLCSFIGIDSLPHEYQSSVKIVLTPEQIARVKTIYSEDTALYESILEAGQRKSVKIETVETPRTLSKLVIAERLMAKNLLTQFIEFLDSGSGHLRFMWDSATEISTDHALFTDHKDHVRAALNITEQEFKDLLS